VEGGGVVLAGGTFLTQPLVLRSNMTLHVEKGAVLLGSPDIADYSVKLPEGFPLTNSSKQARMFIAVTRTCALNC
jgi:polygalacturonase